MEGGHGIKGVLITLLYWLPFGWGNRNRFSLCPYYLGRWGRRGELLFWDGHLRPEGWTLIWERVLIRAWALIQGINVYQNLISYDRWFQQCLLRLNARCKSHMNLVNNLAGYGVPWSSVDKEFEHDNRLEIITLNWLEYMPFKYVLHPHSWQLSNN